jgi:hypothetical protein
MESASPGKWKASSSVTSSGGSMADRAIHYVLDSGAELFHEQHNEPFIVFLNAEERQEVWPLRSKAAAGFIRWRFYSAENKGLSSEAITTALATLAAQAQFLGEQLPLSVRVATLDGDFYCDLGDWRAVRITAHKWEIIEHPPILFRHHTHQTPQVEPLPEGRLDDFFNLVNVTDPQSQLLLKAYLVAGLIGDIPLPVLLLHGEHGSAKSILLRFLRALLDPSCLQVLAPPDNLREFVQLAAHHRTVYLDNLSSLPLWLSDALCRLCTGEGLSKRQLYTDDDDVVYNFRGLGAISGVNLVVTKPDLLDRAIILKLEPIAEFRRRTEEELWDRFNTLRPYLLGAMFDTLAQAMRVYPTVQLHRLPRLADFGRWGVAIALVLGYSAEDFLSAYGMNVASQNEAALEESLVAQAVLSFLQTGKGWEGTATQLLQELDSNADHLNINTRAKAWPKGSNALSRRLREVSPNLRRVGIQVSERKIGGVKLWHLSRQEGDFIDPIDQALAGSGRADGTTTSTQDTSISTPTSPKPPLFSADPSLDRDDGVDKVDIFPTPDGIVHTDADTRRRRLSL